MNQKFKWVGVGIKQTTICTEPTPEGYFKVRWISAAHETRRNRLGQCGVYKKQVQALICKLIFNLP